MGQVIAVASRRKSLLKWIKEQERLLPLSFVAVASRRDAVGTPYKNLPEMKLQKPEKSAVPISCVSAYENS